MASMAQFVLRVRGPTGEKENYYIIDPYAFPNAFYCSNYNSNITKPTCTKNLTNGMHHNHIYILHTHKRIYFISQSKKIQTPATFTIISLQTSTILKIYLIEKQTNFFSLPFQFYHSPLQYYISNVATQNTQPILHNLRRQKSY